MRYILLTTVVLFLSGGQFLFKGAGLAIQGRPLADGLWTLMMLPSLYTALALYGIATVIWIYILSFVPLIEAYPWIAVSTIAVPLIGLFYYGERVGVLFWVGMALIVAGLLLTQIGTQR
jgi:undecaprenyl phosphate-alpha-L-ara4N flippase subunit ArnE